jgi:hypothetical protein
LAADAADEGEERVLCRCCTIPWATSPGDARRLDEIGKLLSVGDRARGIRRAATRRAQGRVLAQRDRARGAERAAIREFIRIHALELALEEPIKLCVSRLLLAVRHAERVRLAKSRNKQKVG